ncbi:septum formation family protein [Arthrobacter agilis]|uniref:septum formation family protein n=1 Tax=Arthrobacter agilis TaxID=37921 RepID=UPI0027871C1B|nr:septum formation family protein [Arthrobacter agilis]MDQ0734975.1 hypothetical protein [Arthrobacter agilis]
MKSVVVRGAVGLSVALFLFGATGCAILEPDLPAPDRDQAGDLVAESETNAAALLVGDCTSTLASAEQAEAAASGESFDVYEVTAIPCEDEHVFEAFAVTTLPDGEYLGESWAIDLADEFCTTEFEEFVGLAYDESELWFSYIYPNNEGWTWKDDRQILCFISMTDEAPTTGTLAGAKR